MGDRKCNYLTVPVITLLHKILNAALHSSHTVRWLHMLSPHNKHLCLLWDLDMEGILAIRERKKGNLKHVTCTSCFSITIINTRFNQIVQLKWHCLGHMWVSNEHCKTEVQLWMSLWLSLHTHLFEYGFWHRCDSFISALKQSYYFLWFLWPPDLTSLWCISWTSSHSASLFSKPAIDWE